MVNRVVSTKLSEEEHEKLLAECNKRGCTQTELLRKAIQEIFQPEEKNLTIEEMKKYLGKSSDENG